jgi:hypothetical protein
MEEQPKEDNICLQFMESIEKQLKNDEYISISFYSCVIIDGININVYLKKNNNLLNNARINNSYFRNYRVRIIILTLPEIMILPVNPVRNATLP